MRRRKVFKIRSLFCTFGAPYLQFQRMTFYLRHLDQMLAIGSHVPMASYQRLGPLQVCLSNVFSIASQSAFTIQQSEAYFVRR